MQATRRSLIAGALTAAATPAWAQLGGLLLSPKTVVDRAIEARSAVDIAKDNAIVVKVNAIMAEVMSIKASTEIYEQRLLITGIFSDKPTYDKFEHKVRSVSGVKRFYWHALYMSEADQTANHLLSWDSVLIIEDKAKARLIGTKDVADVNYRVAADATGTLYVLGLARSERERELALARVRDGDGVKEVVSYVVVRPKK